MPPQAPWWTLPSLASLALLVFVMALVLAFISDKALFGQLATGSLAIATLAAQFFFGSSSGSQRKDETIAQQSAALATSAPVPPVAVTAAIDPGQPLTATTTAAVDQQPPA